MHNSAMGPEHYYDFVVEKLLDSEIDFALGPENVAWCYELGFVLYKVGVLC